jgi:hypothetical protein
MHACEDWLVSHPPQTTLHQSLNPQNLNNHLQLPRIPDHILNRFFLAPQILPFCTLSTNPSSAHGILNLGEVDPCILNTPAIFSRKVDDRALGVEEEEVLG